MSKDKIKIAFFDIDGTIIDMTTKEMTPLMRKTLHQLQDQGIRICIATGRPPCYLPDFGDLKFDAFMTFNGAYCFSKNQIIYSCPLLYEDVKTILRNADGIGRPVALASSKTCLGNGTDEDLTEYFEISNHEVHVEDLSDLMKKPVYQIMLGCRSSEYEAIMKDVQEAKIAAWWDRAADIIPAKAGKGIGVAKILEFYGFSMEEAIAFGDGDNDLEMLEAVGTAVAMGNASDNLKAIADEICRPCAEDGIYHYFFD